MINRIVDHYVSQRQLPSRYRIMKEFCISESKARDIYAIIKYQLGVYESEEHEIEPEFPAPLYTVSTKSIPVSGYRRIGVICDVHFPYQDNQALKLAVKKLKEYEIDTLILNGDIVDFHSVSFWERDPDQRDFAKEREFAVQSLSLLRKVFKNVSILYKEGNHERRMHRYLSQKAPELFKLDELSVTQLLKLSDFGIKYVDGYSRIQVGELDIIHGHEYRSSSFINIANTYLRKTFRNVLFGHYHCVQQEIKRDVRGKLSGAWAVGGLCQLSAPYAPYNNWAHGFAFIELYDNGHFSVRNHLIDGEEVY